MEEYSTIKKVIIKGLRNGYMSFESSLSNLDMVNGIWTIPDEKEIGSTWDIILSSDFAKAFWEEGHQEHLMKMVVMNSEERIQYLNQFIDDDIIIEEPEEEVEEKIENGLMGIIQVSLQRIKEYSHDLYKESCEDTFQNLKPIIEKNSVTELKELDFLVMNSSNRVMSNALYNYLRDIGKESFTLCPECGQTGYNHETGCSINRRSDDYLIGLNDGC